MNTTYLIVSARSVGLDPSKPAPLPIVAGNVGVDNISATFDSEWDGLTILANLANNGCDPVEVEMVAEDGAYTSPIPSQAIAHAGNLFVSFVGRTGGVEVLRSEGTYRAEVEPSIPRDGVQPTPEVRDIVGQTLDARDAANEAAESAEDAAYRARSAAEHAESSATDLDGISAYAQSLPAGVQAAASFVRTGDPWILSLGIPRGERGEGIAQGGTAGQLLTKKSSDDYDTEWTDAPNSAVWGGITGTLADQADLQDALDAKYAKPSTGIPKSDLATGVQGSLDKADSALQEHQSLAAYRTSAAQDAIDDAQDDAIAAKYTKPSGGIPASDLASGVIPPLSVVNGKLCITYEEV